VGNALPYVSPGAGLTASPDTRFEQHIQRMLGRWILGKKCAKDHVRASDGSVSLYLPDKSIDASNWVEVVMVSQGCRILSQGDLAEMQKTHRVLMKWPEYGAIATRYMHQVSPLLWAANEILMEGTLQTNPLHMIDPYVVWVPKET
jgi:hypothetical protein